MTSYHDVMLDKREFKNGLVPLNVYCSRSNCNVLMHKGEPARIYDAATFTHMVCPSTGIKTYAPHKMNDTGVRLNGSKSS